MRDSFVHHGPRHFKLQKLSHTREKEHTLLEARVQWGKPKLTRVSVNFWPTRKHGYVHVLCFGALSAFRCGPRRWGGEGKDRSRCPPGCEVFPLPPGAGGGSAEHEDAVFLL